MLTIDGTVATALGVAVALAVIFAVILLMVTRRTHLRSWRIGLFYESEERFNGDDDDDIPSG